MLADICGFALCSFDVRIMCQQVFAPPPPTPEQAARLMKVPVPAKQGCHTYSSAAAQGQTLIMCVQSTTSPSAAAVTAQPGNSSLDDSTQTCAVAPPESEPRAAAAEEPDAPCAVFEPDAMPNGSSNAAVAARQLASSSEPGLVAPPLAQSATAAPPAAAAGSAAGGQAQPSSGPDVDTMVGPLRVQMDASSPSADITLDPKHSSARQVLI